MIGYITPAAVIAPDLGTNALNVCGLYPTMKQIESRSQTAAAAICKMLEDDLVCKGIVGVVALLGTVESFELSRLLPIHLLKLIAPCLNDKFSNTKVTFS